MPKPKGVIDHLWERAEREAEESYPGYKDSPDEAKRRAYYGTVHKIYDNLVAAQGESAKVVGVTTYKVGDQWDKRRHES